MGNRMDLRFSKLPERLKGLYSQIGDAADNGTCDEQTGASRRHSHLPERFGKISDQSRGLPSGETLLEEVISQANLGMEIPKEIQEEIRTAFHEWDAAPNESTPYWRLYWAVNSAKPPKGSIRTKKSPPKRASEMDNP